MQSVFGRTTGQQNRTERNYPSLWSYIGQNVPNEFREDASSNPESKDTSGVLWDQVPARKFQVQQIFVVISFQIFWSAIIEAFRPFSAPNPLINMTNQAGLATMSYLIRKDRVRRGNWRAFFKGTMGRLNY